MNLYFLRRNPTQQVANQAVLLYIPNRLLEPLQAALNLRIWPPDVLFDVFLCAPRVRSSDMV